MSCVLSLKQLFFDTLKWYTKGTKLFFFFKDP